jgi:hypothetical protein
MPSFNRAAAVICAAALLAACGAETAVFLVAIANDWKVEDPQGTLNGLNYQLGPDPSDTGTASKANITGAEQQLGVAPAPLTGAYSNRDIHFTVRRPDPVNPNCDTSVDSCADDPLVCTCVEVKFSGQFVDADHVHVKSGDGVEDYWLYR